MQATQTQKIECENASRVDGPRVFCAQVQDWRDTSNCKHCSPERKQRVKYEW